MTEIDLPTSSQAGPSRKPFDFLELLRTAADPSSSFSTDELGEVLGISRLPSREEALASLEKEVLAPVKDLSGPELWRWQV
jgi:antiviral helicase SKI2